MVCPRCIETVSRVLSEKGFRIKNIKLGEAEINNEPSAEQMNELSETLHKSGFGLLIDKKSRMVGQIKSEIIKLIHHSDDEILLINLSEHIAALIDTDYSFLSNLFSSEEGITIEKFAILQKIEKAKELLSYGEQTISEIAYKMGYSSASHLSAQFKKITGISPIQYKNLKVKKRKPLDRIGE